MDTLNKHFEKANSQLYEFEMYHSKNSETLGECKLREIFEKIFVAISENKSYAKTIVFGKLSQYTDIIENLENKLREGFRRDDDNEDGNGDFKADIRDQFYVDWKNNIYKVNDLLNDFWSKNRENIPSEDAPSRKIKTITALLNHDKEAYVELDQNNKIKQDEIEISHSKDLEWDNKTELAELIYVLYHSKRIKVNGKPIEQQKLTKIFCKLFNTQIDSPVDLLNKTAKTFKKGEDGKTFISELNTILEKYIDKIRNTK